MTADEHVRDDRLAPSGLTSGNAAKLHCLELIESHVRERERAIVLDLGCGEGRDFRALLERHPHVRYVGVDPSAGACARARAVLAGLDAEIVHADGYDVRVGPADVVVSFSVLEHVYRRRR